MPVPNMKNSTISKILLTLAVLVLFKLIFKWTGFLDIILFISLSYIGLVLLENKDTIKENKFFKLAKSKKFLSFLTMIIWVMFFVTTILLYCANHYYPKGPIFSTGDYICQNDGRGPCAEEFIEEVKSLNVPNWVKFFKKSGGELLWMGLLFMGIILPSYYKKQEHLK